ncbi:MAG TPA: hypothetical protein VFI34_08100 [Candidatus Limnocylindrales bacterium]|nr:hypothetical protein [Candidatus Limnocylindrales bacterium]
MTIHRFATAGFPVQPADRTYRAGVCNIGPVEIARRRRTGVTMTIATVLLLAVLVAIHAPTPLRLIVFFPAAVAASGFLQAWLRFCAGFGWLGVFNFEDVGTTVSVADADARRRDRARAIRVGLACALVGALAAALAVVLPA